MKTIPVVVVVDLLFSSLLVNAKPSCDSDGTPCGRYYYNNCCSNVCEKPNGMFCGGVCTYDSCSFPPPQWGRGEGWACHNSSMCMKGLSCSYIEKTCGGLCPCGEVHVYGGG